ncbi:MAG: glutamate--cysteine ligase [Polyangiales bacterium]|jgi:glutamate--cysteine ligase
MADDTLHLDDLLLPFHKAETPRSGWVIGTEAERFGVRSDGRPVHYAGEAGVATVLGRLADRHSWTPTPETPGGPLISLRKGNASVTLEPGAQIELSGAPLRTIHETAAEFADHSAELKSVGADLDIEWLGLGYHPFARQEDLDWVPKLRYGVMRDYLLTRGSRARDMMRRTCTVQANLDYADESDAIRKLRVGLAATPIVTAMFANSPWSEGSFQGLRSHRTEVWQDVDPDRTGLLPFLWEGDVGYREYVEWVLDAPMFLIKREGRVVHNTGQTFRSFLADGFEGHRATMIDWETHINTMFPEVRLKSTLEMRSTDSQNIHHLPAIPALWKGLLYEDQALSAAEALLEPLACADATKAQSAVAETAMDAVYGGRSMKEWSSDLLGIAAAGLQRLGDTNSEGEDESIYLRSIQDLQGRCPADVLLEKAPGETPDTTDIIAASRFSD